MLILYNCIFLLCITVEVKVVWVDIQFTLQIKFVKESRNFCIFTSLCRGYTVILPGYISIKRAGLTLHWVVQTVQYERMHVQYMLYQLGL